MIYTLVSFFSIVVRNFILPNPFECFGASGVLINWIAGPIISAISFAIVGINYRRGSDPAMGSLLFLVVNAIIILLLWVLSLFKFAWWWILTVALVLFALVIGYQTLTRRDCTK